LSAKSSHKTKQKPTGTRNSGNGEHSEIRKIRNNKQQCTTPEFPKGPAKCGKTKKSKKNKIENKTVKAQAPPFSFFLVV